MSLILNQGTSPEGLSIKTYDFDNSPQMVFLGEYEISMKDFLAAAYYVMTNTNLKDKDPRLDFLEKMKSIEQINGYNSSKKRLGNLE